MPRGRYDQPGVTPSPPSPMGGPTMSRQWQQTFEPTPGFGEAQPQMQPQGDYDFSQNYVSPDMTGDVYGDGPVQDAWQTTDIDFTQDIWPQGAHELDGPLDRLVSDETGMDRMNEPSPMQYEYLRKGLLQRSNAPEPY